MKQPPNDWREAALAAQLVFSPVAREWFRKLGVPPDVFKDDRFHLIATWAVSRMSTVPPELRAILNEVHCPQLSTARIGEALLAHENENQDEALEVTKMYVWKLRRNWLPVYLRTLAVAFEKSDENAIAQTAALFEYATGQQ